MHHNSQSYYQWAKKGSNCHQFDYKQSHNKKTWSKLKIGIVAWLKSIDFEERRRVCCIEKEPWLIQILLKFVYILKKKDKNKFAFCKEHKLDTLKKFKVMRNITEVFRLVKDSSSLDSNSKNVNYHSITSYAKDCQVTETFLKHSHICSIEGFSNSIALSGKLLEDPDCFLDLMEKASNNLCFMTEIKLYDEHISDKKNGGSSYFPNWFKIGSFFPLGSFIAANLERAIIIKYINRSVKSISFNYSWEEIEVFKKNWDNPDLKVISKFKKIVEHNFYKMKGWLEREDELKKKGKSSKKKEKCGQDDNYDWTPKTIFKMINNFFISSCFRDLKHKDNFIEEILEYNLSMDPSVLMQHIIFPRLEDFSRIRVFILFCSGELWIEEQYQERRLAVVKEIEMEKSKKKKRKKRRKKKKAKKKELESAETNCEVEVKLKTEKISSDQELNINNILSHKTTTKDSIVEMSGMTKKERKLMQKKLRKKRRQKKEKMKSRKNRKKNEKQKSIKNISAKSVAGDSEPYMENKTSIEKKSVKRMENLVAKKRHSFFDETFIQSKSISRTSSLKANTKTNQRTMKNNSSLKDLQSIMKDKEFVENLGSAKNNSSPKMKNKKYKIRLADRITSKINSDSTCSKQAQSVHKKDNFLSSDQVIRKFKNEKHSSGRKSLGDSDSGKKTLSFKLKRKRDQSRSPRRTKEAVEVQYLKKKDVKWFKEQNFPKKPNHQSCPRNDLSEDNIYEKKSKIPTKDEDDFFDTQTKNVVKLLQDIAKNSELEREVSKLRLSKVLEITFKNYDTQPMLKPYGSWKTGLLIPNSDIDLQIVNITRARSREDAVKLLEAFHYNIQVFPWAESKTILGATTPLLKIAMKPYQPFDPKGVFPIEGLTEEFLRKANQLVGKGNQDKTIDVDITVAIPENNGSDSTNYICNSLEKYEHLFTLVLLLKYYLNSKQLTNPYRGGLSSYGLSLLVLAWLEKTKNAVKRETSVYKMLKNLLKFFAFEFNPQSMAIMLVNSANSMMWIFINRNILHPYLVSGDTLVVIDPTITYRLKNVTYNSFEFPSIQEEFGNFWVGLNEIEKQYQSRKLELSENQNIYTSFLIS